MSVLTISIVSHGQGGILKDLLADLRNVDTTKVKAIVTLNIPESEDFLADAGLEVLTIRNSQPKGFGANHNYAFALSNSEYFAVVNPDIRCDVEVVDRLVEALAREPRVGVCAPLVLAPAGGVEDSARRFPTVLRILSRSMSRLMRKRLEPDYSLVGSQMINVEWVAGMFMMFPARAFREVKGFDESYFMYLEDADICDRLHRAGWGVGVIPDAHVLHAARRATLSSLRHLCWHLASMARFLFRRILVAKSVPQQRSS